MDTAKRLECVTSIVKWIRANVKVDRTISVGFGPYRYNYDPALDKTEWHLEVDKYGTVAFDPMGLYVTYNHSDPSNNGGGSFRWKSYVDFAEKEETAVNDLLTAWPRIKSRLIAETERLKAIEDFHV